MTFVLEIDKVSGGFNVQSPYGNVWCKSLDGAIEQSDLMLRKWKKDKNRCVG